MLWGEVSLRRAQNKLENFSAVGTIVHYVHNLAVVLCISKSMYCGLKNRKIASKNFPIFHFGNLTLVFPAQIESEVILTFFLHKF